MELDAVAESRDGKALLVGEAKWGPAPGSAERLLAIARNLPFLRGREVVPVAWSGRGRKARDGRVLDADDVLDALSR